MAKITFVFPDYESLGVGYLMSSCQLAGHQVELVYYETGRAYSWRSKSIKSIFHDLISPPKKMPSISYEQIAIYIAQTTPDLAAFSCFTDNYQSQLQIAQELKKISPKILTIFGGPHVTATANRVLSQLAVDSVALGEAEISLVDFLSICDESPKFTLPSRPVQGVMFKKDGMIIGQPQEGVLSNLDLLAWPDKQTWHKYKPVHGYTLITSRGCPYNCSYCMNSFYRQWRSPYKIRRRSINNVLSELKWAMTTFSIYNVGFFDDCFTMSSGWLTEFCLRYRKEIALPFYCLAIPETVTPKTVNCLREAGCVGVQIGVQTLSDEINLEIFSRRPQKSKIVESIKLFKKSGIRVSVDHILDFPGETSAIEEEAVLFYNKHRPDNINVFWMNYFPGTPIVEISKIEGRLCPIDLEKIEDGLWGSEAEIIGLTRPLRSRTPLLAINVMMHYLSILPQWLVTLLIKTRCYRLFRIKSYDFSTLLPQAIRLWLQQKKNKLKKIL